MIKRLRFKLLLLVIAFISVIVLLPNKASAGVNDFTIESFRADYYLSRNNMKTSGLRVEEEILAVFPSFDQNHGILRAIPQTYQGHTVSLDNISVTDDKGTSYKFTQSSQNDNTVLKIGNPNSYAHGPTMYRIKYTLKNVINFQDTDEFYWDINGTEWSQPFTSVIARLHLDKDLTSQLTGQMTCYTGTAGSKEKNCLITKDEANGESIIYASASSLTAGQNVSLVVGFNKGTFALGPEIAADKRNKQIKLLAMAGAVLLIPLITFINLYSKWRATGRDPKGRGIIIPEYVSPKGLNVVTSAYLLNQNLAPNAVTASIIEMAVGGYLKIIEIKIDKLLKDKTEYELQLIKDPSNLAQEQRDILNKLFGNNLSVGDTVNISNQKNKLYTLMSSLTKNVSANLTLKGYFASDPQKAKSKFTVRAIILLIAGFMLLAFPLIGISLIISSVIAFIFSSLMPARSQQGVETRDYLLGLKEYINMAEKDRLAYLQSPQGAEKTPINMNDHKQAVKLFEDLLPYAILFGLEKEWAKQFKDLYTQPPSWYGGNMNSFNTMYLANSLGGFNSANTTAFSAPSSSGSSGFGGGGSSGGGGGGGGGGGW